jgi:2-methylcitrate dehydratase
MVSTAELAAFATDVSYEGLPEAIREAAKLRTLDAVGVAVASVGAGPTDAVRRAVSVQNATGRSRLWGSDLGASPPDAALYNAGLVEAGNGPVFLAPTLASASDSVAAVLAAAEARSATGEDVLAGLSVAHEVRGELAWNAPVDGFHPSTHGAVAAAAGVGRAMGLSREKLEDAVGLAATQATLAAGGGYVDTLAAGTGALTAVYACLLAEGGVEGPDPLGDPDGWEAVVGPFDLDLDPGCERVQDAALLPHDAHPYAQTAVEAAVDLAEEAALDPAEVERVRVETFADAAPELDATTVAAALVDRELPARPDERADLRPVADAVSVDADAALTERAGRGEVPARVVVECRDGAVHEVERAWFTGHPAAPASWGVVEEKFHAVVGDRYGVDRRADVVETVRGLEAETAAELTRLLD